ncbi:hypothetical protein AKJ08_1649 [Vulgatibacter incomptus]|uniref:Uncharacterized protein n=1 Tax=Vulgatibacter incomptus TaxID=1391653 RepID=A0A0K1PCN6_9BACT|nr:hypothetical protein AKJ08_1649 [Vulgatibacter incomptus]
MSPEQSSVVSQASSHTPVFVMQTSPSEQSLSEVHAVFALSPHASIPIDAAKTNPTESISHFN